MGKSCLKRSTTFTIYSYVGFLIFLVTVSDPNGGLLDIPVSFILKNYLRLTSQEVASFRFYTSVPLYVSLLFGLFRDSISARQIRDREIISVFSLLSAIVYVGLAFFPINYWGLVLATTLTTTLFLFIASAQGGLIALLGQQNDCSGEISVVWNIFAFVPAAGAYVAGGFFSAFLERETPANISFTLFFVGAALSFSIFVLSLFRPKSVFAKIAPEGDRDSPSLKRLVQHRPIYPALAIWLLWNFSPGSITPLQYFFQNQLGATNVDWGIWNAAFTASFIPAFVVYGFLTRRISYKLLLWGGTLLAIPQFVPLLFVNTLSLGLMCALPIGLMGGIATAAYLDLIIRSCPKALQGSMIMMSGGIYFISTRCGDIVGTYLYDRFHGFEICVITMVVSYSLIPFWILFIPKSILRNEV